MSLRRTFVLIAPFCVATIAMVAAIPGHSGGSQKAGNAAPSAPARGSDFSVQVTPSGLLEVRYRGVPVVTSEVAAWGPKWSWAGPDQKAVTDDEGQVRLAGNANGLNLKWVGELASPAPNVLRLDLLFRAEKAIPEMIGVCSQWKLKTDAPVFGGNRTDPELLPNNGGWRWRAGGGEPITMELEGADKVVFDGGQKQTIRCFLLADRLEAGMHRVRLTLRLPEGGQRLAAAWQRYERENPAAWFRGALGPSASPVDLSFLNRDDRPAGRRGFVRADGDRLVFADGSPARFWGANLAAYPLFLTPRDEVVKQARRMARLGYNLMRIHHHDSDWVEPNIFGRKSPTTRRLDPRALESLDWWIKCLRDEGIYVWLDMHVGRTIKPGDGLTEGADEVARHQGSLKEFCYYNGQLQDLMKDYQREYLGHLNRQTGLRYRDDPAVIGVLITNENDATHHGCYSILPTGNNPFHNSVWTARYKAFGGRFGLPADRIFQTWMPGPSKLFLAQAEHEFNEAMIADLRQIGVKSPIVTTNFWGEDPLFALPSLTDGDMIDVHSYGQGEELGKNAHYQGNFLSWIAMGQVYGKPLSVSEWNVEYPNTDRFIAPLYVAGIASLQGWDAPMLYNYSQSPFNPNPDPDKWSTYHDPALTGVMPAAALLYRRAHVSPAKKTYCFLPDPAALFGRSLTPDTSATIRTLAEQSKLTIGMPEVRELPWLRPTKPAEGTIVVTDPDRDFLPEGQSFVRSDTGELMRDWELGIQTIDSPRTQAVSGWVGGRTLETRDASFEVRTRKAVVALTSVDDRPLSESRFVLVTAVARVIASPGDKAPYLSEPVQCRVTLRTRTTDLEMLALGRDGRVTGRPAVDRRDGALSFELPTQGGTHWYVLKASTRPARGPSHPGTGGVPSTSKGQ